MFFFIPHPRTVIILLCTLRQERRSPQENARDDFEDEAAEDDEGEEDCGFASQPLLPSSRRPGNQDILSQIGEMGDLVATLTRFLSWSSDLPRRASWSLANLRLARRCCGVCACNFPG